MKIVPLNDKIVVERLEAASYPVRGVEVVERGEDAVDVVATLLADAVEGRELDAVTDDRSEEHTSELQSH